ncbi:hypothetical protein EXIGLDRAFT_453454 [Exidia glandulosa HHB12029]|uniref:Uncharacterized protein n=1 Tax=Exidia glandulosa HHB12029 TaxID=1314781 RepID=A0A165B2X2_EXIGL|nr:hypothetical protein EXIGLDRAFT_453454 [Exidia glandulosa HHB12029]
MRRRDVNRPLRRRRRARLLNPYLARVGQSLTASATPREPPVWPTCHAPDLDLEHAQRRARVRTGVYAYTFARRSVSSTGELRTAGSPSGRPRTRRHVEERERVSKSPKSRRDSAQFGAETVCVGSHAREASVTRRRRRAVNSQARGRRRARPLNPYSARVGQSR